MLLHEERLRGDGLAYFAPRGGRQRRPRRDVLRPADAHRARRADRHRDPGPGRRLRAGASASSASRAALILCFLRHLSEEEAFATLEQALPFREHFIGVGLDSSERGHPPEKFARVFADAGELGLHRVAHAGEEGPPAYIESALDVLKVERIDHGVRCVEDPALVRRLAAERHAADRLPAVQRQAVRLRASWPSHNLRRAARRRASCATINSDDPAYFGGYMNDNFLAAFAALPQLGAAEAYALARNSFEASFVDAAARTAMTVRLDQVFSRFA